MEPEVADSRQMAYRGRTRSLRLAAAIACGIALAACGTGSSEHFQDDPPPAAQVDLSVYIGNGHVSISPAHLGAGPLILYVTNQASRTQTLAIKRGGGSVTTSGHINRGGTAEVSTDLRTGTYDITTGTQISPAKLKVGKPRPNADAVLLQP